MNSIYEPQGRAREYSPLALNIYNGCDHDCNYCYVKKMRFIKKSNKPVFRNGLLEQLKKDAPKFSNGKQVLLSFMSDPYCVADVETQYTRQILEILNSNNVNVAILTKGGNRCLRDLDIFSKFKKIKVGATLTCLDDKTSIENEPMAALPSDRIETLKTLHQNGITTFVSLEPVLDPNVSLEIINRTHNFVDIYKVGKLNHIENKIDWKQFGESAINILSGYNKKFYIKNDLANFIDKQLLRPENRNPDIFD